jgi:hypothetical protein
MGGNRIFLKTLRPTLFNDDLSNEPYFGRISITASGSVFHQLLAALRRWRKSPNLLFWAHQPTSINQATFGLISPFQSTRQLLGSSAHFNQPGNFWALKPFSINQATLDNIWPGTCFFYLPQQLTPTSSPKPRTNGPTYPSTPYEHGIL